jgi:putative transposase
MWGIIDRKCFEAKNLYNEANYIIRQEFIFNKQWLSYNKLDNMMHGAKEYKTLGSQASQNTLSLLDKNWKSYFEGVKKYYKNNGIGFLGLPDLPKYKPKNGRCILMVKNIQCRIIDNKLIFSWKPLQKFSGIKTNVNGKLMQVRFVPSGACYFMEIVYQTEVQKPEKSSGRIAGIDLGVNNFVTMGNNIGIKPIIIKGGIVKSMNQFYNKERARISSETNMYWNNRMRNLTDKHLRKLDSYMHLVSKRIVSYCIENDIGTLIVGHNKEWKDGINIGRINNQNFVCIPYNKLIIQLRYKCENEKINFIETEERFTSGTSFLDNELPIEENCDIKRRIKRGLFRSNNGTLINADLNSAYQIIKKVYPSAFVAIQNEGFRGCDLHPVKFCS